MLKDDSIKKIILIESYKNKGYDKKIVPKIGVEHIENNGRSYPYLCPIGDLVQRSFHKGFHVCTN
jgi:hypothetical protein